MDADRFESPPDDVRRWLAEFEDEGREKGKPSIGLDFRTTWCPRHLEPFRVRWPKGAAIALVELFREFTADERAQKLAGGDALKLAAVVAECSPLCCFVSNEALDRVYAKGGVRRGG